MTKIKRLLALLLCLSMLCLTVGCEIYIPIVSDLLKMKAEEEETIPKIAFGRREITDEEEELILSEEALFGKELLGDDYRASLHYDRLTSKKQTVYRALEFALENDYPYIYVDEKIASNSDILSEVLEKFALDSPLLEQNLSYQLGEFTTYYDVGASTAELSGYYIEVDNFYEGFWKKKLVAIEAAERLIASMPKNLSETEKAKYLHRKLLDNIEYYDYTDKSEAVHNYLYDAFITGRTHCDGSANAYGLLLNLAGIKCVEKQHTGENTVGHTWNFVFLDGEWYNIDATAVEERDSVDYEYRVRKLFGFSDELQQYIPDYQAAYPEANSNIGLKLNDRLSFIETKDFISKVKKAYRENKEKYACFLLYYFDEDIANKAMQKLANELDSSVYWILYEGKDEVTKGRAVLVVFSE